MPSTRDRLVRQAMRLFAEKGYRATTVGEIEAAAGLSPRAGGLYKHYASKRDLFEAGIERHVGEMDRITGMARNLPGADLRSDLTLAAQLALAELAEEREMMQILQRDGREFPEIQELARDRIVRRGFAEAELLIRRWVGDRDGDRTPATSAVLFSSLVNYHVLEVMIGEPPGGLGEDEFVAAWVDLAERYIAPFVAEGDTTSNDRSSTSPTPTEVPT